MKIIVDNVVSQAVIGGRDNLLSFNLRKELEEYLTIKVHGGFYAKKKNKFVKGYRTFITSEGMFATGFLPLIAGFLKELGVVPDIEDKRANLPRLKAEIDRQVGSQVMRDDQVGLMLKLNNYVKIGDCSLYWPRGIYDAATNAGKTTTIAGITLNWENTPNCLFVTHSATVYEDAVPRFKAALGEVGEIGPGKYEHKQFTIAMAKTLYRRVESSVNALRDLQRYQVLYVDETHRAGGDEYSELLKQIPAGARLFVSGTPLDNEDQIKNMIIIGLSSRVLGKVTNKELIDLKVSQRPVINVYLCDSRTPRALFNYQEEMEVLIHFSKVRVAFIAALIKDRIGKGLVVVSFNNLDHGRYMYEYLTNCPGLDMLEFGFVSGATKIKDREYVYQQCREGGIDVLLTSRVLNEGANIHTIRAWIRAEGGKSKINTKQITGRAIRNDGVNEYVEVIEIFDKGKYITPHVRKRLATHAAEGYEIVKHYDKKQENLLS